MLLVLAVMLVATTGGCSVMNRLDMLVCGIDTTNRQLQETNARLAQLQETADATEKRLAPLSKLAERLEGLSIQETADGPVLKRRAGQ